MKKDLIGIAIFLATFFLGTATASVKKTETAPLVNCSATEVREPVPEEPTVVGKPALPEKPAVVENDVTENNYGGWYALDKFKGMNEVTMIAIFNSIGVGDEAGGIVFTTFENYGDQGAFGTVWMKIDGNHVKFGTEKIKGVRYRFEGTFASADWGSEGEKPLYGTLQKFVKGKRVAEVSGNFEYFEPHCWH